MGVGVQTVSALFIGLQSKRSCIRFAIEYEILDLSLDALIGCLEQGRVYFASRKVFHNCVQEGQSVIDGIIVSNSLSII